MPRILKFIAYLVLFVFSFILFLYWMFPYEMLKDRVASAIERPFGGTVEVSIGKMEPYYFTGFIITNLKLIDRSQEEPKPLVEIQRVRARASLFSLLLGNPSFTFLIRSQKGEIAGSARQIEEGFDLDVDVDGFDVGAIKWLESRFGIKLTGEVGGSVVLKVDRTRPARTTGKIDLSLDDFKIVSSQITLMGSNIPLPDLVITKGRGSRIKLVIDKGTVSVDEFRLAEGDFSFDLKGKVFLSTVLANYRLNLNGSFRVSDKLNEAVPILFMVEKQKQQDGSYPLSITGRVSEPSIKIGTFTVPL